MKLIAIVALLSLTLRPRERAYPKSPQMKICDTTIICAVVGQCAPIIRDCEPGGVVIIPESAPATGVVIAPSPLAYRAATTINFQAIPRCKVRYKTPRASILKNLAREGHCAMAVPHHRPKNLPKIPIASIVPRIFTSPCCACAPPWGGDAPQVGQTNAFQAVSRPQCVLAGINSAPSQCLRISVSLNTP